MPRKLLRVALVAAILPVLAPETSSAQAVKPASTVRTTAATQPKKGVAGWLQKMRGEKPAPVAGKIIKVSDENPFEESTVKANTPFDLEGNADVRLLKSNSSGRRRPTAQVQEFEPIVRSQQNAAEQPLQNATVASPSATPLSPASRIARDVTATDIDNPFPDDVATTRRGRQVVVPATPAADRSVQQNNDVATPVSDEMEPDTFPIESAAPPSDVNAAYQANEGAAPEYRRTNMQVPPAPDAPITSNNDVKFANPNSNAPAGRIATRMNAGPAVIDGPHSALPLYGQTPMPAPVYGGGPAGYARLDAALYPSPRQDIPGYVGSTMITNQAFAPHEMLYAHHYRGLYGPFYHKTCRTWVMTPFGICKNEKRVLVGTEVRVNYKSSISPFSLFFPPVIR